MKAATYKLEEKKEEFIKKKIEEGKEMNVKNVKVSLNKIKKKKKTTEE
jgi:hypothetical protein